MDNIKVFAVSVQGDNHKKTDKECQDYSIAIRSEKKFYEHFIGEQSTWERKKQDRLRVKPQCCIAIVADGHGGDEFFRSSKGAQFAAESTRKCIIDFLEMKKNKKPTETEVRQLIKSILKTWNEKVQTHLGITPFGNSELIQLSDEIRAKYLAGEKDPRHAYGTTLIAAVKCDTFWFGFHIGDGKCTVLNQDCSFSQPIPWDERCFLNVTTSVCDDDSAETARIYVSNDSDGNPLGIFLCSDGIDDSYPVNDNEKYLSKFYRSLALNFIDKDFEKAFNDVREVLPLLSKKGSGDDMSLSCILNIDGILRNAKFFKGQIEEEEKERKNKTEDTTEIIENKVLNKEVNIKNGQIILETALQAIRTKKYELLSESNYDITWVRGKI
jgi:serine/threonine protein phosphatase PrpC